MLHQYILLYGLYDIQSSTVCVLQYHHSSDIAVITLLQVPGIYNDYVVRVVACTSNNISTNCRSIVIISSRMARLGKNTQRHTWHTTGVVSREKTVG